MLDQRAEEEGQFLRHDGEVGVQNHEHVTASGAETGPDIFGFADAGPLDEANFFFRVEVLHAADFAGGAVGGLVVAKKNFGLAAHFRDALNSGLDVADFVATRNHDRDGDLGFLSGGNDGPRHHDLHQAKAAQSG